MNIHSYWRAVIEQDAEAIRPFFDKDAYINWHNTNEHFTVDEFIRANCEYPGKWDGEVERVEKRNGRMITATHVYAIHQPLSFHVVSFILVIAKQHSCENFMYNRCNFEDPLSACMCLRKPRPQPAFSK